MEGHIGSICVLFYTIHWKRKNIYPRQERKVKAPAGHDAKKKKKKGAAILPLQAAGQNLSVRMWKTIAGCFKVGACEEKEEGMKRREGGEEEGGKGDRWLNRDPP